jgi:predicted O-methyltransferase YrrM
MTTRTGLGAKAWLLLTHPGELPARLANKLNSLAEGHARPRRHGLVEDAERLSDVLGRIFGPEAGAALREPALAALEAAVAARLAAAEGGFAACHNASSTLGRLCYAAARVLRPAVVVETGVARGVTSAYILAALEENGHGTLDSIDLPPLAADEGRHLGCAIPDELRGRWTLHRGASRDLLAGVITKRGGGLDLFVHDSLHTARNMRWELATALAALNRPGALVADDIEGNDAFLNLVAESAPAAWTMLAEEGKRAVCGCARYGSPA